METKILSRADLSNDDSGQLAGLLKKKNTTIGILLIIIFSGIITYALIEYSKLTQTLLLATQDDSYLVRHIPVNKIPRAFAVVTDKNAPASVTQSEQLFSKDTMGISFAYPITYSSIEDATDNQVLFRNTGTGDVLVVVRHPVDDTVSINDFVTKHEQMNLSGCFDIADCVVSEDSESATVNNFPTLIQTSNEMTAFVRGDDEVYEILTTGGANELERFLESIRISTPS